MMATTMLNVMKYFEYKNAASFRTDWNQLTETDRDQLKAALDGETPTLTY